MKWENDKTFAVLMFSVINVPNQKDRAFQENMLQQSVRQGHAFEPRQVDKHALGQR